MASERQCRDDWVVGGAVLVRLAMDKYIEQEKVSISTKRNGGMGEISANHDALAWKVLIMEQQLCRCMGGLVFLVILFCIAATVFRCQGRTSFSITWFGR